MDAAVNSKLSLVPKVSWELIPANTNINEGAHSFTNRFTGTGLSLFAAIER
jgi:hypothetical protein